MTAAETPELTQSPATLALCDIVSALEEPLRRD